MTVVLIIAVGLLALWAAHMAINHGFAFLGRRVDERMRRRRDSRIYRNDE